MATELSPEQIAKGYYTDISGVGTALEKAQEQQVLRAKAQQEQQNKLYQGIKDISGVFDNKYAATGTSADPILLAKINKQKNDLIQGLMTGKVSPSSAYMMASSGVADINNLAGTISQYRQNTEKKIADLKKDHPELNSEQLLNDAIKSAIYNPESGEIVAPNANYDYASTLFNQDRLGRYTDKELLNRNNQERWKALEGTQGFLSSGPFVYEHRLKPGQTPLSTGGGMGIDFKSVPVGINYENKVYKKNGKTVTEKVNVGFKDMQGADNELTAHFIGDRGLKSAALYKVEELNNYAQQNPEFAKKWNTLDDNERFRVAALDYAKSNLGTGGSFIKPADLSAQAQYQLRMREASKKDENNYINPIEAMIRDYRSGVTDENRLLSHFKDQGILMGYAKDAFDDEGKPLKIYGSPKIVGGKLMITPYGSYRGLDAKGNPIKDLKFSDGTPITQGRGYDLLNRNKGVAENEINTMMNVYSRLNEDQPKIYTKQ